MLFRSVAEFAKRMKDTPHRKRAMLVVTDGADDVVLMQRSYGRSAGAGTVTYMPAMIDYSDRAIEALWTNEVLLYGIGLNWEQQSGGNSALHVPSLQRLAEPTGGAVGVASTIDRIELGAKGLADELRHQYTLGFYPQKRPDGKYRRLKVVTKNPEYRVRTRAGYLARKP